MKVNCIAKAGRWLTTTVWFTSPNHCSCFAEMFYICALMCLSMQAFSHLSCIENIIISRMCLNKFVPFWGAITSMPCMLGWILAFGDIRGKYRCHWCCVFKQYYTYDCWLVAGQVAWNVIGCWDLELVEACLGMFDSYSITIHAVKVLCYHELSPFTVVIYLLVLLVGGCQRLVL